MRTFPPSLAAQALSQGLRVHNYYQPPFYAEVFVPKRLLGCMVRGHHKAVKRFLALFAEEHPDLAGAMEIHDLGTRGRGAQTALCFPDWQFEPEEST